MSKKIKGLTVQIGGDTTELSKALKEPNKEASTLQSKLTAVNKALKFDPGNSELLAQKQRILGKEVDANKNKLNLLKQAQKEFNEAGRDVDSSEYIELQKQIFATENKLKSLKKEQTGVSASFESFANKSKIVGDKMQSVGKSLMPISLGLVAAGTGAFKFASDTNEALNKVDTTFGESSNIVKKFADTSLNSFGIAKGSALDMAGYFGDMATSMGKPQEEAAKMSVGLVGLAGDLASFKNMSVKEVMTGLSGIFTGETESLKRLGIVMTETNLEQFALSEGSKLLYKEMSQAEKVQLRYEYVTKMSANSIGDFTETNDAAANQVRTTKESIKELAANFGEVLLPIITPIIAAINDFVKGLNTLDPNVKTIVVVIGLLLTVLSPLLILFGKLASSIMQIKTFIGFLGPVFTALGNIVTFAMGIVKAAVLGSLNAILAHPIIAFIAAIIAVFVLLYTKCEWFRDGVNAIVSSVIDFFNNMVEGIISCLHSIIDSIIDTFNNIGDFIFVKVPRIISDIVGFFASLPGELVSIGANLIQGLWQGISDSIGWLTSKISSFCDGVIGSIRDFFDINSPSRKMSDLVGKFLPMGIGDGVEKNRDYALRPLSKLVNDATKIANAIKIDGNFDYSGVGKKLNNAISVNSEILGSTSIVLDVALQSVLDGKVVAKSTTRQITKSQKSNMAFKGA